MKKILLIKNPELFQGEKNIRGSRYYFEGWYFKNTNGKIGISFIPGISITNSDKKAFIQIITKDGSYFIDYSIDDFKYSDNPFYIEIGNNYFSRDRIYIDIKDEKQSLMIDGELFYLNSQNIGSNFLRPNIMGFFSYFPFMECNHAILSMRNNINGVITFNNDLLNFNGGIGYIEKDWGISFPKSYIWCQGNIFLNSASSFMLSIADIPFKIFNFRGIICSLIVNNKEFRFATYNNTKLVKYDIGNSFFNIVLRKKDYYLHVEAKYDDGFRLIAPVKGSMEKTIIESIFGILTITLKKGNKVIFYDTSKNCGVEIVV